MTMFLKQSTSLTPTQTAFCMADIFDGIDLWAFECLGVDINRKYNFVVMVKDLIK